MLIVPGRPSSSTLTWWVLWDASNKPTFRIDGPGHAKQRVAYTLKQGGDQLPGYDLFLVSATELEPDSRYVLSAPFSMTAEFTAESRTLPQLLAADSAFTVALGSCYCMAKDRGLSACYPPAMYASQQNPIRLRFLCGDQIYMDLSPTSGSPLVFSPPDPWRRYFDQWLTPRFRDFITKSPNIVMADDHEFWNDYPHDNVWLPWTSQKEGKTLDRIFSLFQSALNVDPEAIQAGGQNLQSLLTDDARAFSIDVAPLSFFVLDTRTGRNRFDGHAPQFSLPQWLQRAKNWLAALQGPGVLVLSQPLVEKPASLFQRLSHTMGDVNLPDYETQYSLLWEAVLAAPHDVLIVSGDIHWSRCYLICKQGESTPKAYEVISSPLACIPGSPHDVDSEPASGSVKWNNNNRSAKWTSFATPSSKTPIYATLAFTKFGVQVRVEVRWWTANPQNVANAIQVSACELYLN